MRVSAWSVIKNEAQFIGYGVMSILPWVDEIVYFDGNSTDGTLELLKHIKGKYDKEGKIKVFKDRDFKDFKEDYVRVFNECMKECTGDFLFYCHPDMILTDPGILKDRSQMSGFAYLTNIRSFAGEDLMTEIISGRAGTWKNIMANKFGIHYYGHYGATNEDMYFYSLTGHSYLFHKNSKLYPYKVRGSGICVDHYCECKPRGRREQKMETVLKTAGLPNDSVSEAVALHPRVTLDPSNKKWGSFCFRRRKDDLPEVFGKYRSEFDEVLGKKT